MVFLTVHDNRRYTRCRRAGEARACAASMLFSTDPFANIESSSIAANADMRVGEIRQFCKLQGDGQIEMRSATSCCA